MKNLQLFPFERNQYYHGKLMTYQDMTSEQKYMNDKRRLNNRFLHGIGVASGLQVVRLDEKTLSVEAGVALDFAGREIVLEEPRVLMLDQIEGYEELTAREEAPYAYLCLAYDETGICEARENAALGGSGEPTYEKYREGGKLYLTQRPLEDDRCTVSGLTSQGAVLFENNDLVVSCRLPAFVRSGDCFDVLFRIEARRPLQDVSVEFSSSLSALNVKGKEILEFKWNGSLKDAGDTAELKEQLTAYSVEYGYGTMTLRRRQLRITVDGREYFPAGDITGRVLISSRDTCHQMQDSWYAGSMHQFLNATGSGAIYLAGLHFRKAGEELRIDRIDQLPFEQRVYSSFVNKGLIDQLITEVDKLKAGAGSDNVSGQGVETSDNVPQIATGVCTIPLGIGGRAGERYFSGEIIHGLGLGRLRVDLSLETDTLQYIGSSEIFEDMKLRAEMAAKVNSERGSFVIGIRLLEASPVETARIRWSAQLLPENKEQGNEPHIRIVPDKPELKCMQSRYFRTETEYLHGATILWEVCTPNGGTVTRDGQYTAPDTEGIYELRAFCQENPRIRSSVFVIVRE